MKIHGEKLASLQIRSRKWKWLGHLLRRGNERIAKKWALKLTSDGHIEIRRQESYGKEI